MSEDRLVRKVVALLIDCREIWDGRRVGSSRFMCNMEKLRAGYSYGRMAGKVREKLVSSGIV